MENPKQEVAKKQPQKITSDSLLKRWWIKVAVLTAVNLICIVVTLILQGQLAQKADELKKAKIEEINNDAETNVKLIEDELTNLEGKYSKILPVFPNSDTILDFINIKEDLVASGILKSFSFVGDGVIKDRLSLSGLPVLAESEGDLNLINQALTKIGSMPYLIREIKVEVSKEATSSYNLKYGGFLYTDENFTQN